MMHQDDGDAEPVLSSDAVPPAPEPSPRNPFRAGVAFGTVVTIAVGLLIVQNGKSAQLDWLAFHFRAPLWIMLMLTAAAGAVAWQLLKMAWRHGSRIGRERKSALRAAKETGGLTKRNTKPTDPI